MTEKLKIENLEFGPYETNTFLMSHEDFENEYILIESPPSSFQGLSKILKKKPKIHLILTHGHWDHVTDAQQFQQYGAKIYVSERDYKDWVGKNQDSSHGKIKKVEMTDNVQFVKDGDELNLLGHKIRVITTPGHTAGGICLYFEKSKKIFVGDTLFRRGIGRTDMAYGSFEQLKKSITEKLYVLPDDVEAFPGHGSSTKIGEEKKYNQYV